MGIIDDETGIGSQGYSGASESLLLFGRFFIDDRIDDYKVYSFTIKSSKKGLSRVLKKIKRERVCVTLYLFGCFLCLVHLEYVCLCGELLCCLSACWVLNGFFDGPSGFIKGNGFDDDVR
jgi:hypothetical protein